MYLVLKTTTLEARTQKKTAENKIRSYLEGPIYRSVWHLNSLQTNDMLNWIVWNGSVSIFSCV